MSTSYEEFADAQARLDDGEPQSGDEELTGQYDQEVLQPEADRLVLRPGECRLGR